LGITGNQIIFIINIKNYQALFLSTHIKLSQYQILMGSNITNQPQSSTTVNLFSSAFWLKLAQGTQNKANTLQVKANINAIFLVGTFAYTSFTQKGVLSDTFIDYIPSLF
jgi:hypothetical protein